ncbi:peptidylprolyl isomerase [Stieleria sp. TO1_6]|uniref:peptidylprolyl isomerase n=1 Tax=Stieleria tagensis TaxID=2956795 RepID=UPI00209B8EFF|nr:peptidylprolyl isomerase [Stieleria tagensis]MCO8123660.1 peptidylprolyl isomerase [Stieleria tagensis]
MKRPCQFPLALLFCTAAIVLVAGLPKTNAQPPSAQPSTAQPPTTQPSTAQPPTTQPSTAQPPTTQPTTTPAPTQPGGSPAAGTPAAATSEEQVTDEQVLKAFQEKAPAEDQEPGTAAVDAFHAAAAKLRAKTLEMRRQHTLVVNGYSDDTDLYRKLRTETRLLINQTYRAALNLLDYMPYPTAARFAVTVLEHRVSHGVYDKDTHEGAARLMDAGVRLLYVAQAAARAGMVTGDFDLADRIYEKLEDGELEDTDRALLGQEELIKKQFETEQELIANDPEDLPKARFLTTRGEIVVELFINEAPSTVAHFINLIESGFYDGLDFFQVVDGLLALTGDPLGDGSARPERYIADEHTGETVRMPLAGSLVMAKLPTAGNRDFVPNSAGTQFAILFMPIPAIIEHQTVFGRVIEGLDVVGELRRVDPTKEKEKNQIVLPPDRILHAEMINRPETLPEVNYAQPPGLADGPPASGP